jgi:hypothetical protein
MTSQCKNYNNEDCTTRTYEYERSYIVKTGEIKNYKVTLTRHYKPNAGSRIRREYTDEQKNIINQEYELLQNYTATSRVINKKYDFTVTPHFVKKWVIPK